MFFYAYNYLQLFFCSQPFRFGRTLYTSYRVVSYKEQRREMTYMLGRRMHAWVDPFSDVWSSTRLRNASRSNGITSAIVRRRSPMVFVCRPNNVADRRLSNPFTGDSGVAMPRGLSLSQQQTGYRGLRI